MALTLERNFIWMLVSQGIFSAGQWLMVILLARGGGSVDVGQFGFALAIVTPIMIFFNLSLRTVYVTSYQEQYDFQVFWHLRLLSILPALLSTLIIILFIQPSTEQAWVILLVALSKSCEAGSDMLYAIPHKNNRLDLVGKSMVLRAVIGTLIFALAYWVSDSLVMALFFYSLSWLLVLLAYDRYVVTKHFSALVVSKKFSEFPLLLSLIKLAIPMGLASFLTAVAISTPRFVLEQTASISDLGIFSALTYFVMLGTLVVNVLGQASRSPLAQAYSEANFKRFWGIVSIGSGVSIALGLGFWISTILLGRWVLLVIYGQEFAVHHELFELIGLLSLPIFLGGFLGFCLSCMGSYMLCLVSSIVILLASILGSIFYIPTYQMEGAAYSTALFGVAACLQILPMIWRWKVNINAN